MAGFAKYYLPAMFHLGSATSLHLVGDAAISITQLIGLKKMLSFLQVTTISSIQLPLHCNGNTVYIFLFWELHGLGPNFHIHVSVSNLYIPRINPHISSSRKGRPIVEIYNSLTDT